MNRLADPTQATKLALRSIAARVAALDTEIAALDAQLGELVTTAAPRTLALLGVGVEHAAQLPITAGANLERLHSEKVACGNGSVNGRVNAGCPVMPNLTG